MNKNNLGEIFEKFQESSIQIEKFNEILENFSDVLKNLNGNIAGVVELTQMEGINEISKKAIINLQKLQNQYTDINMEYEKLISLDMYKENINGKIGELQDNVYLKIDKVREENKELKDLVLKILKITEGKDKIPSNNKTEILSISNNISDLAVCLKDEIYFRNSLDDGNLYKCNKDGKEIIKITKDHDICYLETDGKTLFYLNKRDGKVYNCITYKKNSESSEVDLIETVCIVEEICNSFKLYNDYVYYISDLGIRNVKVNNKDDVKPLFNGQVKSFEIIEDNIYFECNSLFYKMGIEGKMVVQIV